MSDAVNNPYKRDVPDKTLTREGVPADAKAVGDAIKGLLTRQKIRIPDINVTTESSNGYYYSKSISISAELPDEAVVLVVTANDWSINKAGAITIFANCEAKTVQIMGAKKGTIDALYIDVLYM